MTELNEDQLSKRIAQDAIAEIRSARRWRIFFYSLFALYLLGLMTVYLAKNIGLMEPREAHTALIDINGVISDASEANADSVVTGLRKAFENELTAGVILRINSPGGSPVQAGYINDEIQRLKLEYPDTPVYAVISDICASGGYYIASAADFIYADKASMVGSIGVVMASFGFVDAIDKLGVERRLFTAGENKGLLDPFSPLRHDEVGHISGLLKEVHQQFIDVVKQGRGDRLQDDDSIFTGLVWTGEQALELGLVDALGSSGFVAREVIGAEEIVDYTRRETLIDRFAKQIGSAMANVLASKLQMQLR